MRIAGLDIGSVRIGIALSDVMGMIASPVETFQCTGDLETDAKAIADRLMELKAGKVVFGFPKNMNGTLGPSAEKVLAFKEAFSSYCDLESELMDERLSTVSAHNILRESGMKGKKRKKVVDQLAAQLILQNYLDMHR